MNSLSKLFSLLLLLSSSACFADDKSDISTMLTEFLAQNEQLKQHQNFWADDLVYTSSNGTRFGKAQIINGMSEATKDLKETIPFYSAEEVVISVHDTTAILTFKLIAKESRKNPVTVQEYLNTGTLLKRKGSWQVVAWQATKIPTE